MLSRILIMCLLLVNVACFKRTKVKGRVYSRNNIPVPNVIIDLHKYGSSSYPIDSKHQVAHTDENGNYEFVFTNTYSRWRYYRIHADDRDSGRTQSIVKQGKVNHLDLYLR